MVEHLGSLGDLLAGVSAGVSALAASHSWAYRRGRTAGRRDTLLDERLARLERELEDRPDPERPRRRRRRWKPWRKAEVQREHYQRRLR